MSWFFLCFRHFYLYFQNQLDKNKFNEARKWDELKLKKIKHLWIDEYSETIEIIHSLAFICKMEAVISSRDTSNKNRVDEIPTCQGLMQ